MGAVRSALEALVCETIHQRLATEVLDFSDLDRSLEGMRQAAEDADRERFYDFDLQFHRALWSLADNEYLAAALEQVTVPLFAFFIVLYMRKQGGRETLLEAVEAHEKLAASLRKQDRSCIQAIRDLVSLSLKHHQGLISE